MRLVGGLSVNFFGHIARVRDQVFLPRRDASEEEVLLRKRDLQTSFDYQVNVNLRFTFGSIFNNIVKPRFDFGGGFLRVLLVSRPGVRSVHVWSPVAVRLPS